MTIYKLAIRNGGEEFYSLKEMRKRFKEDKELFELLREDGYFFCTKENEASRTEYFVIPLQDKEIKMEYRYNERLYNGAYGN
jgi:hypothetical protein